MQACLQLIIHVCSFIGRLCLQRRGHRHTPLSTLAAHPLKVSLLRCWWAWRRMHTAAKAHARLLQVIVRAAGQGDADAGAGARSSADLE